MPQIYAVALVIIKTEKKKNKFSLKTGNETNQNKITSSYKSFVFQGKSSRQCIALIIKNPTSA